MRKTLGLALMAIMSIFAMPSFAVAAAYSPPVATISGMGSIDANAATTDHTVMIIATAQPAADVPVIGDAHERMCSISDQNDTVTGTLNHEETHKPADDGRHWISWRLSGSGEVWSFGSA